MAVTQLLSITRHTLRQPITRHTLRLSITLPVSTLLHFITHQATLPRHTTHQVITIRRLGEVTSRLPITLHTVHLLMLARPTPIQHQAVVTPHRLIRIQPRVIIILLPTAALHTYIRRRVRAIHHHHMFIRRHRTHIQHQEADIIALLMHTQPPVATITQLPQVEPMEHQLVATNIIPHLVTPTHLQHMVHQATRHLVQATPRRVIYIRLRAPDTHTHHPATAHRVTPIQPQDLMAHLLIILRHTHHHPTPTHLQVTAPRPTAPPLTVRRHTARLNTVHLPTAPPSTLLLLLAPKPNNSILFRSYSISSAISSKAELPRIQRAT